MKREIEVIHYNELPDFVFKDNSSILDVGSRDGYGAWYSRHRNRFLQNDYLGVDVQSFQHHYLKPIITNEFLQFETERKFDLIIFSHILEHFEIQQWTEVLTKLVGLLSDRGYLVINVPFKKDGKGGKEGWDRHKVFQIDEKLLAPYLPFMFERVGKTKTRIVFRNPGEGILRPSLRFVWRILCNHKYSILRTWGGRPARLVAVYQKELEE